MALTLTKSSRPHWNIIALHETQEKRVFTCLSTIDRRTHLGEMNSFTRLAQRTVYTHAPIAIEAASKGRPGAAFQFNPF